MKKLILSAILFLGITATGFSQEKAQRVQKSPEERAQMATDMLDKKLSLTESQKTQIYQIHLERAKAMGNFKGKRDTTKSQGADHANRKAQFEATESKILAVLNDAQKVTYNQLKAEREAKMKNHQGERKKEKK